ncbi:MAG: cytochrome c, partial [Oricola sp.]
SADAMEGEAVFNAKCASCHGENAAGQAGVAPPLVHVIYEPNHHSDAAFHIAAQRGARAHHWPFGDMPPVAGVGEAEVDKIVTYVRTLQRANGIY